MVLGEDHDEKKDEPMKLTTTTQVSVDGVMQGPGAPVAGVLQGPGAPVAGVAERGAFERSGWAHFDNEASSVMDEIFGRADAFLLAGGPTRSSPVPGEHGTIRATARSGPR